MNIPDLEQVHFSRTSKAKYRCHLTAGVFIAATCWTVGSYYGIGWLVCVGEVANVATAIFWIWE